MKKLLRNLAIAGVCAALVLPGTANASLKSDLAKAKSEVFEKNGLRTFKSFSASKDGAQKEAKKPQFSEDTIVIKYKNALSRAEHTRLGAVVIRQDAGQKYIVVKVKNKAAQEKALKYYLKNKNVVTAQPSVLFHKFGTTDPKASKQYHLSMLKAGEAQSLAGKRKVKVAVIDTGIDLKHPELKNKVISSVNIIDPANPGQPDSHGTHVAGIIAGEKGNGIGGYGINPNADILSIDVFSRGSATNDYTIVQAIDKAVEQGARVINMSLGSYGASPILADSVKRAIAKGVTIVASAGNEAWDEPSYPASYEGVISVSSLDSKKSLSWYSNFGPSVDIAAPGEEVYSSIYEPERKSSFRNMSGTSMAAPVVAGAASLLLAKNPSLTPAQVEYILKATAQDLGARGYDTKYGSGLVNPTAALKYNVKKLPAAITKKWTDKEIQNEAQAVSSPLNLTKAITKPGEQHWVKFAVKEGEYIQTSLKSFTQYDHKLTVKFFGDQQYQSSVINKVQDGKIEGRLFKAPFTGVMAIGVQDVNGNYDPSSSHKDKYTLKVTTLSELPEDTSSLTNMNGITSIPFKSSNNTFLSADKEDYDYFTFKADGDYLYNLNISGVAGVNSMIHVYREDSLFPQPEPGETPIPEDEKMAMLKEMLEGKNAVPGEFTSNRGGSGEGETLYFQGEKDTKYIVKVTNKPSFSDEDFFFFFFGTGSESSLDAEPSAIPYTLNLTASEAVPDEDSLPFEGGEEEEGGEGDGDLNGDGQYDIEDEILYMEQLIQQYKEAARPLTLGKNGEGYLQSPEDLDLFMFKPDKSGYYKFNTPVVNGQAFTVEIAKLTTEDVGDGKKILNLSPVGDNLNWSGWGALNSSFHTGLKKGETYFMAVTPNWFADDFALQKYSIGTSYLYADQSDKYEENDLFKNQAKKLPANGKVTGNFAMPNDMDAFTFSPSKTGVYQVLAEDGTVSAALRAKLPKELFTKVYKLPVIIEDVNKNGKYDGADYEHISIIEAGIETGTTHGSFKAVKGKKYFIVMDRFLESGTLSLVPYNLSVVPAKTVDEDAKSVIKNNRPSKPVALKASGSKVLKASGYLNAGVKFGDEDWFTFTLKKDTAVTISLAAGKETDMNLSLYKDGKLLSKADYYPEGDDEVMIRTLKKGTYHVKVRDFFGNSSIKPYELKVTMK
ncbi:S8 family serine peptidase [Peribacillus sp. SCS-37]|uniref:S8 family serine peptidase n=1 Tax=Paraperibacillus esterisolvens TaxID=3115296 RepID=UPI0039064863